MRETPKKIQSEFDKLLAENSVPEKYRPYYRKWLRFYLDFCEKYNYPQRNKSSKSLFLKKLSEKQQPEAYQRQASHAISIYYQITTDTENNLSESKNDIFDNQTKNHPEIEPHAANGDMPSPHGYRPTASQKQSTYAPPITDVAITPPPTGPSEWDTAKKNLTNEIKGSRPRHPPPAISQQSDCQSALRLRTPPL